MGNMELQKDDEGNLFMRPGDFRLHVATGEEAEQHWPAVPADEQTMPPLDMTESWRKIVEEDLLQAKKIPAGTVLDVNARIMVKEISYHLLASIKLVKPQPQQHTDRSDGAEADPAEGVTSENKKDEGDAGDDEDAEAGNGANVKSTPSEATTEGHAKSVYGASLTLKLQWEDQTKQKMVPHRTYAEMGQFISQVTSDLRGALHENEKAGQAVLDSLALDLTLVLLARYMEGIESGVRVLEESAYELLNFCAEQANPREMCLPLRTLGRKIDVVYAAATSYLILQPLMTLWTKVVLRIPRKRSSFVSDVMNTWDRLYNHAEGYEMNYVDDESTGVERPGRIGRIWNVLLEFFESLVQKQESQRKTSETIRLYSDGLGRLRPEITGAQESPVSSITEKDFGTEDSSSTPDEKKGDDKNDCQAVSDSSRQGEPNAEAADWVRERRVILARVLLMQGSIWNELQPPAGDERDRPHMRRSRSSKNTPRPGNGHSASTDETELNLCRCLRLMTLLGWTNPVLVCQVAASEMNLDPSSKDDDLWRAHVGVDRRSKREKKGTSYSMNSVGMFLCGVLRPRTRQMLDERVTDDVDDYQVDLNGTGFDLLDPMYALDLALPYIMTMISQATRTMSMAGVIVINKFLQRIPDESFCSFDEMMRVRCGTNSMGQETNLAGLAHHVGSAIAACDDPRHRRLTYETFQTVLRKVKDPHARYSMVEGVFHDCKRVAVQAQLITEMKDAVRYSDKVAESGTEERWSDNEASILKTRFAELVLPKYLMPRKELLMSVNAIVAVASATVWLAGSDKRTVGRLSTGSTVRADVERRMRFVKAYCRLGRECVRALASAAQHDRKRVPNSKLAKDKLNEAQAIFAASGRTLNNCVAALGALSRAEECLQ